MSAATGTKVKLVMMRNLSVVVGVFVIVLVMGRVESTSRRWMTADQKIQMGIRDSVNSTTATTLHQLSEPIYDYDGYYRAKVLNFTQLMERTDAKNAPYLLDSNTRPEQLLVVSGWVANVSRNFQLAFLNRRGDNKGCNETDFEQCLLFVVQIDFEEGYADNQMIVVDPRMVFESHLDRVSITTYFDIRVQLREDHFLIYAGASPVWHLPYTSLPDGQKYTAIKAILLFGDAAIDRFQFMDPPPTPVIHSNSSGGDPSEHISYRYTLPEGKWSYGTMIIVHLRCMRFPCKIQFRGGKNASDNGVIWSVDLKAKRMRTNIGRTIQPYQGQKPPDTGWAVSEEHDLELSFVADRDEIRCYENPTIHTYSQLGPTRWANGKGDSIQSVRALTIGGQSLVVLAVSTKPPSLMLAGPPPGGYEYETDTYRFDPLPPLHNDTIGWKRQRFNFRKRWDIGLALVIRMQYTTEPWRISFLAGDVNMTLINNKASFGDRNPGLRRVLDVNMNELHDTPTLSFYSYSTKAIKTDSTTLGSGSKGQDLKLVFVLDSKQMKYGVNSVGPVPYTDVELSNFTQVVAVELGGEDFHVSEFIMLQRQNEDAILEQARPEPKIPPAGGDKSYTFVMKSDWTVKRAVRLLGVFHSLPWRVDFAEAPSVNTSKLVASVTYLLVNDSIEATIRNHVKGVEATMPPSILQADKKFELVFVPTENGLMYYENGRGPGEAANNSFLLAEDIFRRLVKTVVVVGENITISSMELLQRYMSDTHAIFPNTDSMVTTMERLRMKHDKRFADWKRNPMGRFDQHKALETISSNTSLDVLDPNPLVYTANKVFVHGEFFIGMVVNGVDTAMEFDLDVISDDLFAQCLKDHGYFQFIMMQPHASCVTAFQLNTQEVRFGQFDIYQKDFIQEARLPVRLLQFNESVTFRFAGAALEGFQTRNRTASVRRVGGCDYKPHGNESIPTDPGEATRTWQKLLRVNQSDVYRAYSFLFARVHGRDFIADSGVVEQKWASCGLAMTFGPHMVVAVPENHTLPFVEHVRVGMPYAVQNVRVITTTPPNHGPFVWDFQMRDRNTFIRPLMKGEMLVLRVLIPPPEELPQDMGQVGTWTNDLEIALVNSHKENPSPERIEYSKTVMLAVIRHEFNYMRVNVTMMGSAQKTCEKKFHNPLLRDTKGTALTFRIYIHPHKRLFFFLNTELICDNEISDMMFINGTLAGFSNVQIGGNATIMEREVTSFDKTVAMEKLNATTQLGQIQGFYTDFGTPHMASHWCMEYNWCNRRVWQDGPLAIHERIYVLMLYNNSEARWQLKLYDLRNDKALVMTGKAGDWLQLSNQFWRKGTGSVRRDWRVKLSRDMTVIQIEIIVMDENVLRLKVADRDLGNFILPTNFTENPIRSMELEWDFPFMHILDLRVQRNEYSVAESGENATIQIDMIPYKQNAAVMETDRKFIRLKRPLQDGEWLVFKAGNYSYQTESEAKSQTAVDELSFSVTLMALGKRFLTDYDELEHEDLFDDLMFTEETIAGAALHVRVDLNDETISCGKKYSDADHMHEYETTSITEWLGSGYFQEFDLRIFADARYYDMRAPTLERDLNREIRLPVFFNYHLACEFTFPDEFLPVHLVRYVAVQTYGIKTWTYRRINNAQAMIGFSANTINEGSMAQRYGGEKAPFEYKHGLQFGGDSAEMMLGERISLMFFHGTAPFEIDFRRRNGGTGVNVHFFASPGNSNLMVKTLTAGSELSNDSFDPTTLLNGQMDMSDPTAPDRRVAVRLDVLVLRDYFWICLYDRPDNCREHAYGGAMIANAIAKRNQNRGEITTTTMGPGNATNATVSPKRRVKAAIRGVQYAAFDGEADTDTPPTPYMGSEDYGGGGGMGGGGMGGGGMGGGGMGGGGMGGGEMGGGGMGGGEMGGGGMGGGEMGDGSQRVALPDTLLFIGRRNFLQLIMVESELTDVYTLEEATTRTKAGELNDPLITNDTYYYQEARTGGTVPPDYDEDPTMPKRSTTTMGGNGTMMPTSMMTTSMTQMPNEAFRDDLGDLDGVRVIED